MARCCLSSWEANYLRRCGGSPSFRQTNIPKHQDSLNTQIIIYLFIIICCVIKLATEDWGTTRKLPILMLVFILFVSCRCRNHWINILLNDIFFSIMGHHILCCYLEATIWSNLYLCWNVYDCPWMLRFIP